MLAMSILVDENTSFIIQGITGREAVNMTRGCPDSGSKVVGRVTPGRGARGVYGLPGDDTGAEAGGRAGPTRPGVTPGGVPRRPPPGSRPAPR